MLRFVLRRLASGALAIAGVSVLVFLLLYAVPGDPVDNMLGEQADAADRQELRRFLDLDKPPAARFAIFVHHVADGTLGRSFFDPRVTVASKIAAALPRTAALAAAGMAVALLLALPLGVLAAWRARTRVDTAATVVALAGLSVPNMWLGPILILVFYVRLGWLPGPADEQAGLAALVLPALALGVHLMAMLMRMTRTSMLEVLAEDYVRTARAKGLPTSHVLFKHALRNALVPVITVAGHQFGALLAGAVVVEKIFARPGVGTLLVDAIFVRDQPVVQGCVLVIACSYVLVNLLVDLAYGWADPRIRIA